MNGIHDFVEEQLESGNPENLLGNYLAEVSLLTDQDTDQNDGDCVTLMTVHAAKGLEFKNIIIVGVEEELFPSAMSMDSMSGIEEERRLLYVAITRAMRTCVITYATSRYRNGETKTCQMSRFLRDIDQQYLQISATSNASGNESFGQMRNRWRDNGDSWRANDWTDEHPTIERNKRSVPARRPTLSPTSPTTPPPGFKPVGKASTPAAAANGKFIQHNADELDEGMTILHPKFGRGVITTLDQSGADAKIIVNFSDVGMKTMLLKFARFQIV